MLNISKNNIDERLADKQLYSLKVLRTPGLSIYLARVLIVMSGIALISLFMPWQQNIRGRGKVTALNPANRPQTVQSVIPGRIAEWHVVEGQFVAAGDTLLEISEVKDKYFDPEILTRLREQVDAKKSGLMAKNLKRDAYQNQIKFLRQSLTVKLQQTENKITQTELKVESDSIKLIAEEVNFENYSNIFERNKRRYEAGNITRTKFQEMETKFNEARAKLISQQNALVQSRTGLTIAITDLAGVQAEYAEKISKATTELQATLSEINESQAEIAKLENEYASVAVRREQYFLKAPQTGFVVQALKVGIGETIKEGEAIVTIQPDEPDLAVEMYVRAMDVPLIQQGRKVRIQFDGWPAIQFSGWPSVSVGTFGGNVQVIDRVNDENGSFRILVVPDPEEDPWPEQLRLGSATKGWVMLDNVRIWYEVWRQLNGFPPSLYEEPDEDEGKDTPKNKIKLK